MKRRIMLGVFSFVVAVGFVRAQDVDDVVSRLQNRYDSLRDLSASFTQTVRFGVTRTTQTFEGKIWMKK